MGLEQLSAGALKGWKVASEAASGFSGGGEILRLPQRSAADEDRDDTNHEGELGERSCAHGSSFGAPSPALSRFWAGVSVFGCYHPLYTTNGEKSQEGETNIEYGLRR